MTGISGFQLVLPQLRRRDPGPLICLVSTVLRRFLGNKEKHCTIHAENEAMTGLSAVGRYSGRTAAGCLWYNNGLNLKIH